MLKLSLLKLNDIILQMLLWRNNIVKGKNNAVIS